jgi:hypothetical protein
MPIDFRTHVLGLLKDGAVGYMRIRKTFMRPCSHGKMCWMLNELIAKKEITRLSCGKYFGVRKSE